MRKNILLLTNLKGFGELIFVDSIIRFEEISSYGDKYVLVHVKDAPNFSVRNSMQEIINMLKNF
jgi:uncharacterized protein YrrD